MKAWKNVETPAYVNISFYPGTGNSEFDFIDAQEENRCVHFTSETNDKHIKLEIPAMYYKGEVKIYMRQKAYPCNHQQQKSKSNI